MVRRALDRGLRLRSVLCAPERADALRDLARRAGAPLLVADRAVLAAVTGFHVHRGVLASVVRPPERDAADVVAGARGLLVVCEGVVSTTNLGLVARSAAGLGAGGLLLDERCADPLYRRAVRTSMGQVLVLPWARVPGRWPGALLDLLHHHGVELWALTPAEDAEPLDRASASRASGHRVAVLLGEEGPGLSPATLRAADRWVSIPMARDVDSLNVAATAAVACWELRPRT